MRLRGSADIALGGRRVDANARAAPGCRPAGSSLRRRRVGARGCGRQLGGVDTTTRCSWPPFCRGRWLVVARRVAAAGLALVGRAARVVRRLRSVPRLPPDRLPAYRRPSTDAPWWIIIPAVTGFAAK